MPPTRETASLQQHTQRHVMPELSFFVQPEKEYRFRYDSELRNGSHGRLKGRQTPEHGSSRWPIVHLYNYFDSRPVKLLVTFYTPDGCHQHAHKLLESSHDSRDQQGVVAKDPEVLPNGTLEWKLDTINDICYSREVKTYLTGIYGTDITRIREFQKSGVLHVTAVYHNNVSVCPPINSEIIFDSKFRLTGTLNIDYVDKVAGKATGSDAVIILCSKIPKKLIKSAKPNDSDVCVEFFEKVNEKIVWRELADLKHIHHQVAILFDTPAYRNENISDTVDVWMQLRTKDGEQCSEPLCFQYFPKDDEGLARKRRKVSELDFESNYNVAQPVYAPFSPVYPSTGNEGVEGFPSTSEQQNILQPNLPDDYTFNPEIDEMLDANLLTGNDPMLSETIRINFCQTMDREEFTLPMDDLDEVKKFLQIDSKTNAAKPVKSEESKEADQVKLESATDDQKPPPPPSDVPQTNGGIGSQHPDKYLAYKLALHTAQCLHNFAKTGNVRNLLMSMRHLVALQDEQGDNAIHAAVIHSQGEAMENLVEVARTVAEYDILNMCNELKESPLHIAVQTGQVKAIKLLLYHGANPNVKDRKGNTPIHLAAQSKNAESLMALLESKAYITKYKKHAPDLNALNFSGFSALHLAVLNDSLQAIKSLWFAGCDVDVRDRTSGRTALHIAVERHNLEIVQFLLHQAGAETDIHMFNGNTPLHLACSQNHTDTVAMLMQAKADPYLENYERAENSEDESDSLDAASLEDEDIRGLTSMDLASSEEIRSLLRGEMPLSAMSSTSTVSVPERAVEVAEVLCPKGDSDKADPGTDSGIGLSGRGFSSHSISQSKVHKKLTLSDILDTPTQTRLAKILDGPPDYNWRKVLVYLDMGSIEKTLATHMSPTLGMLHYIQASEMELFEGILGALELYSAKDVLQEAKDKWEKRQDEESYLDSKMQKMKL